MEKKAIQVLPIFGICFLLIAPTSSPVLSIFSRSNIITLTDVPQKLPTTNSYTFTISLSILSSQQISASDGQTYILDSFKDCMFLDTPGKPKLPIQNFRVRIPSDAINVQVRLQNLQMEELVFSTSPYPAERPVLRADQETSWVENEFCKDEDFYMNNKDFYPKEPIWISEQGNLRGVNYITISFSLFQYRMYDNIFKRVIGNDVQVEVTWTSKQDTSPRYLGREFQRILNGLHLQNYVTPDVPPEVPRSGQVSYPTNLANPSNKADYLIITANAFYSSPYLLNLANHRAGHSGLNVSVVKTSSIYAAVGTTIPFDPHVNDTEDTLDLKIKTFIRYVFYTWNQGVHKLVYVLLVGDPAPEGESFFLPFHENNTYSKVTDLWYSCINDDTGNGYIDDNDTAADLLHGRLSVQTSSQLYSIVDKIINWELNPPVYPQDDWGSKTLLTSGNDRETFLVLSLLPYIRDYYFTPHLIETNQVFSHEYDHYLQVIQDIKTQINAGNALFIHNSHGSYTEWGIQTEGDNGTFGRSDVPTLQNGDKLPVIISMACFTGGFDYSSDPCLAEAFVREPNKGAIAYIGSPRIGSLNGDYIIGFLNALLENENYVLGGCTLEAELASVTYMRDLYNLLGDPALDMSQTLVESTKPELACSLDSYEIGDNEVLFHTTINNIGLNDTQNVLVELFENPPLEGGVCIATRSVDVPAQTTIPFDIFIPLQQGYDVNFYLIVDRLNQMDELNEWNNIDGPLYVNILTDFSLDFSCSLDSFDVEYGYVILHTRVNNSGVINTHNVLVELFENNPFQGGTDIDDATRFIDVPAQTTIPLDILIPLQQGWITGYSLNLYLIVDRLNKINESNEVNNVNGPMMFILNLPNFSYLTYFLGAGNYPDISQNKIVWQDSYYRAIYLYDLGPDGILNTTDDSGEVAITTDYPGRREYPSISGNKIVWQDTRNNYQSDIYLYDLGPDGLFNTSDDRRDVRITTNPSSQTIPVISGNKIVWKDDRNGNNDVYFYNLGVDGVFGTPDDSGEISITTNPSNQYYPRIFANKIIWTDDRNNRVDIYLYDLGPDGRYNTADDTAETRITSNQADIPSTSARIFGNRIVWFDQRHTSNTFFGDVYLYDLGADGVFGTADDSGEVRITANPTAYFFSIDICGTRIVWQDFRNDCCDIFLYDLGPDGVFGTADDLRNICLTTTIPLFCFFPEVSGNKVVFIDDDSEICLVELHSEADSPSHFCVLKKFPFYPMQIDTGAMAMTMVLDYLMWNSTRDPERPPHIYNESFLYTTYAGGNAMSGDELANGLNSEINDKNHQWIYGYFFTSHGHQNIADALRDIAIWIDFNVSQYNDIRQVDVPKPGHPYHTPAAIPLEGNYNHWITLRGIFTNKTLWADNHTIVSRPVTVYGFWVNDPKTGGLGGNTYVTAQRLINEYYLRLNVPNDPYQNTFLTITDPASGIPVDESNTDISVAEPLKVFTETEASLVHYVCTGKIGAFAALANTAVISAAKLGFNSVAIGDGDMRGLLHGALVSGIYYGDEECTVSFTTVENTMVSVIVDAMTGSLLEIRLPSPTVVSP